MPLNPDHLSLKVPLGTRILVGFFFFFPTPEEEEVAQLIQHFWVLLLPLVVEKHPSSFEGHGRGQVVGAPARR